MPFPRERDGSLRDLLRELSDTLHYVVGPEDASGFINVVGQRIDGISIPMDRRDLMGNGENDSASANATASRALALLYAQADSVRIDLANLRRELAQVTDELSHLRTASVLEGGEQLVQAAVHADTAAQTAVSSLDELTRRTQLDELTGALNRTLMHDRIDNAIAMAKRHGTQVGLIFVDLDAFKPINDRLGHAVGDAVLQLATRRLEESVRESDSVSRHGGDEFLVLLAELASAADAAPVAQKILEALGAPGVVGPHSLSLSASLGIAVYPEDGDDALALIAGADGAMYQAKKRGPGGFAFCSGQAVTTIDSRSGPMELEPLARRPDSAFAEHEARLRELLEANRQLVDAAQTAQRLQANAEEAHQRQINFVAMAAHALRNPLTALRMATATLTHPTVGEAAPTDRHRVIDRQTALMARLIDDLIDGSRVGAGKFRLFRSDLRLDAIIATALDACRHAIDVKQLQLRLDLADEPAEVNGDPQRLMQVFSNLLNNAARRAAPGGAIALAMEIDGAEVVVRVTNDGVGIAPEALPRIFDLFTLDTNVPLDDAGLGIGLAVVHELVRAHGGTVSANSAGAKSGSEFVVRLPRAPQAAVAG